MRCPLRRAVPPDPIPIYGEVEVRTFALEYLRKMKLNQSIKQLTIAGAMSLFVMTLPAVAQTTTGTTHSQLSVAQAGTQAGKVFGAVYAPVGQAAPDQVQVVYYRSASAGGAKRPAANVYIDGHYQTSLLPNGYTMFCVKPGQHTLGAYMKDAPHYKGKTQDRFSADLKAGMTYFLKVREDGSSGAPVALPRAQAEQELQGVRAQVHALSRASSAIACQTQAYVAPAPAPQYKDYTLQGDVLFAFGKSGYQDINPAGRTEIQRLVDQMRRENTATKRIVVVGHADQIGAAAAADALGLRRAQTVRRVLIERGIPASHIVAESAGNTEPVVDDCRGSRQQMIACLAPNRRVVVRADMSSPN